MSRSSRRRGVVVRRAPVLAVAAACAVSPQAPAQTCNCSCDPYLPPNKVVDRVELNESGAGPTVFLGAPVTTAMKHATIFPFSPPMTITHVCVSLKNSTPNPFEPGAVEFAAPDPLNGGLPAPPFYSQPIVIQPDYSGIHPHQVIEINPPLLVAGPTWVIVSYPSAQGNIGHQGARARLFNDAAVYRADTNQWLSYDATGTPGYVGNTPIIRPLTLSNPPVTCPGGGFFENEAGCGVPTDTTDGGCNSTPPVFLPIACGQTVCGTGAWDGTNRDTDWYELTLTQPQLVTWSAYAEFDVQLIILQQDPNFPPCGGYIQHALGTAGAFQTASVSAVLGAGTYWLFVAPDFNQPPFPCAPPNAYTATVDCCSVSCPPGSIQESEACGADTNGGCTTLTGFEPAACGQTICGELFADNGLVDEDWWEVTVPDVNGDAQAFAVLTVNADMPVQIQLHDDSCSSPFPVIYNAITAPACTPTPLFAGIPAPATFHILVRPDVPTGYPCGSSNGYTVQIDTGIDCGSITPPPNDDCGGSATVTLGTTTFDLLGATPSAPVEPNCFGGPLSADDDVWFRFSAPCTRLYEFQLVAHPGPPFDRMLAVYDGCPPGPILGCFVAPGGIPAILTAPLTAGQTAVIRAGAPGGGGGAVSDLNVLDAIPCSADIDGDCQVGVTDLLDVLGMWGPCPGCPADITGPGGVPDGVVDVVDLLDVLGLWGPCR